MCVDGILNEKTAAEPEGLGGGLGTVAALRGRPQSRITSRSLTTLESHRSDLPDCQREILR